MDVRLIRALAAPLMVIASPAPGREPMQNLPRLSSGFGVRVDPLHGRRTVHRGIDLPGTSGTPILASAPGTVRFAGVAGSYGNMIEIDHGNGLRTRYAHVSRIFVRAGAAVARGDIIALMGSTGRSTGSHLHFEVRSSGKAVDPLGFVGMVPPATPAADPDVRPHRSAFARSRVVAGLAPSAVSELPGSAVIVTQFGP